MIDNGNTSQSTWTFQVLNKFIYFRFEWQYQMLEYDFLFF